MASKDLKTVLLRRERHPQIIDLINRAVERHNAELVAAGFSPATSCYPAIEAALKKYTD